MSKSLSGKLTDAFWVVAVFAAILAAWEAAVRILHVPEFVLPLPGAVLADFLSAPDLFGLHALFTIGMATAGFFCASLIGLLLAFAIVTSRTLDRVLMTFLALIHSVPKVALAPLFVIWLGTGFEPKIAIATLMSILIIVVESVAGLRSVDPEVINLARVNQATPLAIMLKIRLPNALPHIFSAWKVAISLSLIGAIVGEFVGGQMGLGYLIPIAEGSFDTPRAFAAVVLLSVISTALFYLIVFIEALAVPWHVSRRGRR